MIYLAQAIHSPGPDPLHPVWDTLIGLRNKATDPITARIILWNEHNGSPVPWPNYVGDVDLHCDVVLQPGLAWAGTFIPGNGFTTQEGASAQAAQNFQGHATIACITQTPFGEIDRTADVDAFALAAFNWKSGSQIPTEKNIDGGSFGPSQHWSFPYAIPHFDDSNGTTATVWSTGLSIQNVDGNPAAVSLLYTINQCYAEKGQKYRIDFTIPGHGGARFDLLNGNPGSGVPGLTTAGYPNMLNSEGAIDIVAAQPVLLVPSLIVNNRDWSFQVGAAA